MMLKRYDRCTLHIYTYYCSLAKFLFFIIIYYMYCIIEMQQKCFIFICQLTIKANVFIMLLYKKRKTNHSYN